MNICRRDSYSSKIRARQERLGKISSGDFVVLGAAGMEACRRMFRDIIPADGREGIGGMLRDFRNGRRQTGIDRINGHAVREGRRLGTPAPFK